METKQESAMENLYNCSTFFDQDKPGYVEWLEGQVIAAKQSSRENFVKSAMAYVERDLELSIPHEEMDEMVGLPMITEWYDFEYDEVSPSLDTAPRETILELLANEVLSESWPTYGSPDDTFIERFLIECKNRGWIK